MFIIIKTDESVLIIRYYHFFGVSENEAAKSNIIISPNPSTGTFNINSKENVENCFHIIF